MLTNIRSVVNKINELEYIVGNNTFDIIALCETWLSDNVPNSLLCCNNQVEIIRKDRKSRGGGICFLVSKVFKPVVDVVIMPDKFTELEMLSIDITDCDSKTRFILVYRPPSYDRVMNDLLADALQFLCRRETSVVILGDVNLPGLNWSLLPCNDNSVTGGLVDYFIDSGLHQLIDKPTRDKNILDLVFVTDKLSISNIDFTEPIAASDHCCIHFSFNYYVSNIVTELVVNCGDVPTVYCYEKADWLSFKNYCAGTDWSSVFSQCVSVNDYWAAFHNTLRYCIDMFVPIAGRRVPSNSRRKQRFEYPAAIRKFNRKKVNAWRKYAKFKTPALKSKYKACSLRCKQALTKFVSQSESNLIENGNLGAFYKYANSKTKTKPRIPPLRDLSNKLVTDNTDKANLLNNFFSSVYVNDNNVLPTQTAESPTIELPFVGTYCTPELVRKAIHKSKGGKSCGPDNIPGILLKNLVNTICYPLCTIFNISLSTSSVPSAWKSAVVVPVFKKGSTSDPSNYRPISLTCTAGKILEAIVKDNILSHMTANNLISPNQFGFLAKRSTTSQLLESVTSWCKSFSNGVQTDVIYMDFAKAFDSVLCSKLLVKLERYGINGLTLNWIQDFLHDRSQHVRVENSLSGSSSVRSGVPQGSVLGPLLFVIFINDICKSVCDNILVKLFADDVKLYIAFCDTNSPNQLQTAIDSIVKWSNIWQLTVSPTKCAVLSIGKRITVYDYNINNTIIPRVNNFSDLGVIIDSSLTFEPHITSICNKARQRAALILKCFTSRNPKLLTRAFTTFVRPSLEYASCVWSPQNSHCINMIESIQRNFTNNLFGKKKLSYSDRLTVLAIDSLERRRLKSDLCMYYKILNAHIDLNVKDYFLFARAASTRGHNFKLVKPICCTNFQLNQFGIRCVNAWNALPSNIVNANSVQMFKRLISTAVLSF